jgi:hypothetical protein
MGARSGLVAFAVATIVATTPGLAQSVRGTLRDSITRELVPGALVTLTDSAGAFLSRGVSDSAGRFSIARFPQTRRIRVIRIGYHPYEGRVPATDDSLRIAMNPIPSLLATVSSSVKRVCPGDQENADAIGLWEQARAALLAGVVDRETRTPRVRLRSFWRTFDPVRRRRLDDSVSIKDVSVDRSYVAARPAWAFAEEGYMRESVGGDREYFAPDDNVLLDPTFAATHCLRTVVGDATHPGQVGIGFEPVEAGRPDTLVDVSGVLWMDQAKPALRSLEFHYTNLEYYARNSGGEVHFGVTPRGAPIIDRWVIHSAILAIDEDTRPNSIRKRPPPRPNRQNVRLLAYQDVGGEIAFADWDGNVLVDGATKFTGVVVDTAGRRVAGARVWLRETSDTTVTAADGTFALSYTAGSTYVVLASDSTLATQGISRTVPKPLNLSKPGNWDVWLTLYPRQTVLRLTCPANAYKPGTGVLLARVVDEKGDVVPKAMVDVEARQAIVVGDTLYQPRRSRGEAGLDGRFVVCGADLRQPIFLRATDGTKSATGAVTEWTDEVQTLTLVLKNPS